MDKAEAEIEYQTNRVEELKAVVNSYKSENKDLSLKVDKLTAMILKLVDKL